MKKLLPLLIFGSFVMLYSCTEKTTLYLGGDFSYVNEMEDCGGVFRENGKAVDTFELFAKKGANISRLQYAMG